MELGFANNEILISQTNELVSDNKVFNPPVIGSSVNVELRQANTILASTLSTDGVGVWGFEFPEDRTAAVYWQIRSIDNEIGKDFYFGVASSQFTEYNDHLGDDQFSIGLHLDKTDP